MKHFIYTTLVLAGLFAQSTFPVLASVGSSFTASFTTLASDFVVPSTPTGLVATPASQSQINLTWTPSTDNIAVGGYVVYRNSFAVATTTSASFVDTGLFASTTYTYEVQAFDTSFNYSGLSASAATTTLDVPVVVVATSTPAIAPSSSSNQSFIFGLQVSAHVSDADISFGTIAPARSTVSWGLTSDLEAGSITSILYSTLHEVTIPGLVPNTHYFARVSVVDVQGNQFSYQVEFTTLTLVRSPLVNPSDFTAEFARIGSDGVNLSWTNPSDTRFDSVRIVRGENFFPRDQFDGKLVYEGGRESFFDTTAVAGKTYYYAIFAKDAEGNYSSGALAQASSVVGVNPFVTAPQAGYVDPLVARLTIADFEFIQQGKDLVVSGTSTVMINGMSNLTIRLAYNKVPEVLKTIAVSLTDPKDSSKAFIFLLRANSDKTFYEASIGALNTVGSFPLAISVLDYQNQSLKQIAGSLQALVFSAPASSKDTAQLLFLIILVAIIVLAIYMVRSRRTNSTNKLTGAALVFVLMFGSFTSFLTPQAQAAINQQINYQGKLTNASNIAVADGSYTASFSLYTVPTGGAAIWTELDNGSNKVVVKNGLFSVMLGSTTPFTGVDFNQTLYLGVTIEADAEMTPRKVIGTVPSALVAQTIQNITPGQLLRSDIQNSTSTSSTFISVLQSGAGKIAEFFGQSSFSVLSLLSNGNVGVGTSTPGSRFAIAGAAGATTALFSVSTSTSGFATTTTFQIDQNGSLALRNGATLTLNNLNGPLQANNGVVSATSSVGVLYGGTGVTTAPSYGNILVGNNTGGYTLTSTSSLGLPTSAYPFTSLTNYGTTNQATTGIAWFQNGLNASSTSHFVNASTTALTVSGTASTTNLVVSNSATIGGAPTGYGSFSVKDGSSFTAIPGYGVASIGKINSTTGWNGTGFLFTNASAGSKAFSMVYNNDTAYFGEVTNSTSANWMTLSAGGIDLTSNTNQIMNMTSSAGGYQFMQINDTNGNFYQFGVNGNGGDLNSYNYANNGLDTYTYGSKVFSFGANTGTVNQSLRPLSVTGHAIITGSSGAGTGNITDDGLGNITCDDTCAFTTELTVGDTILVPGEGTQSVVKTITSDSVMTLGSTVSAFNESFTYVKPAITAGSNGGGGIILDDGSGHLGALKSVYGGGSYAFNVVPDPVNNPDSNLTVQPHITLSTGVAFASVNAANTANLPMEFRASQYNFWSGGSVAIGNSTPTQPLDVQGNMRVRSGLYDGSNSVGTAGYVLMSTATGVRWVATSSASGAVYPFTPLTNFGATNQATTGIAWFQNGLNASSTSNFVTLNASGQGLFGDVRLNNSNTTIDTQSGNRIIVGAGQGAIIGSGAGVVSFTSTASTTFSNPITSASGNLTIGSSGTTNNIILNPYGGNVGIGTATPTRTLDVIGSNNGVAAVFRKANTANGVALGSNISNNNSMISGIAANGTSFAQLYIDPYNSGVDIGSGALVVLSTGNVGIGTTSPYAKLSVVGQTVSSYFTATTSIASTFPYASTTALTVAGTNGLTVGSLNGPLQANNGVVSATSSVGVLYGGTGLTSAPSYGQVLVGNALGGYTLTATSSLGITGGSGAAYPFTPLTNYGVTNQATTGIAWFQNGINASSTSHFVYASTTALSVSGSATVGSKLSIGTANQDYDLSFSGGGVATIGSAGPGGMTGITIDSTDSTENLRFTVGDSEKMRIDVNGYVGIGTQAPAYALDVNGFVNVTGTTGYKQNGETILVASSTTLSVLLGGGAGASLNDPNGLSNTAIGYSTLGTATSSVENTAVGYNALANNATNFNTAVGTWSMYANTYGIDNTAIGGYSLRFNTTGSSSAAGGTSALQANTTGSYNTGFGKAALRFNSTGSNNTALGFRSLFNALGSGNVGIGFSAGKYETGSDSFYVDNQDRITTAGDKAGALLYGKFNATAANQTLIINASTTVAQNFSVLGTGSSYFTGNLGIGTTSPFAKLSVVGQAVASYFTATTSTASSFPYASTTA
ncbi:MAG: hypothetical protein PHG25_02405, partial [Candidatus Pacebacteria bacterium]|nr:hypothetical protein [Candidatus Paceibacterota bacterium]